MGGIADEHVEWAVVDRLKAMLDAPPVMKFNVTQSFALFSAIVIWTKQRAWVPDDRLRDDADHAANGMRVALGNESIFDPPWSLSKTRPDCATAHQRRIDSQTAAPINGDFEGMTAQQFVKWLRDALAHGDGRTVKPVHRPSRRNGESLLAGFEITGAGRGERERTLTIHHADMKRIGAALADLFCRKLSGGDRYFEGEAGTRIVEEAA